MGTIRFELRTEKQDKERKSPIRLIYQISGQRKYYSTGLKTFPQTWDSAKQQVLYLDKKAAKKLVPPIDFDLLPSDKEAKELNGKLSGLKKEIETIESRFELDNIVYSADMVVNRLTDKKAPTTKTEALSKILFDFIDKYITDHQTTREAGSLSVYKALKNHLQDYQRHSKRK